MARLPETEDPTLQAINWAIEERAAAEPPRPYLGMSSIARDCLRELWLTFRWAGKPNFPAAALKRFADGHLQEDVQADRLRLVEGVELDTVDPETGKQFGFVDLDGHFRGHADGKIRGILQAPKTPHIWEHKSVNPDKFSKMEKLKYELGEKRALEAWDSTYHGQAQLYMHYAGFTRHYMTISTPGGRDTTSCRTDYDPAFAAELIARARRIIEATRPPARVSERPDWWQCRMCSFQGQCHGDQLPPRNCRTCAFASPAAEGAWFCGKWNDTIPQDAQHQGCAEHRFIPPMVPAEQIDAGERGEFIEYRLKDGSVWIDGEKP